MTEYTTNLKLELPPFNNATWHDAVNGNFTVLDQFLYALTGVYVQGYWQNSTAYTVGQKILDSVDGRIYRVLVNHTSSAAPATFESYRVANPTHWELVNSSDNDVGDILSAVTPAANKLIKFTSGVAATTIDITAWGQAWIAFANVGAAKTELGISSFAETLLDDANAAAMRTTLGLGDAALETIGVSGDRVPKLNANNTHSGTFTVTDAFTSRGINDDATAERLLLENTAMTLGPSAATAEFNVKHVSTAAMLSFGTSSKFKAFGSTHATKAHHYEIESDGLVVYEYDRTQDIHIFRDKTSGTANFRMLTGSAEIRGGSAATPGLGFIGDDNTGIYRVSENVLGFTTNGTLAASINASGDFTAVGDVTAFSDVKLKKDIKTIQNALAKVNQLRGVEFMLKRNNQKSTGLIAQEVQEVIPEVVHSFTDSATNEETLSIAYANLVGLLIEAIKELSTKVVELEEQINATP